MVDEIVRTYDQADIERLRGSIKIEYTLARRAAEKLRKELNSDSPVAALGALTGTQAGQQVRAGLRAI